MQAKSVSPNDVNNAIAAQNLILPAGTEKIGDIEYNVKLNASTLAVDELNDLPIKKVNGSNPCSCATSPMSATASARRPTWCASTATAPC